MNDYFALRFNLQKSGYTFEDNPMLLGGIFGKSADYTAETLNQYKEQNTASANELKTELSAEDLALLNGKSVLLTGDSNTSDRLSYGKIAAEVLPCKITDAAVSGSFSVSWTTGIDAVLDSGEAFDAVSLQIGTNDSIFTDKECKNTAVSIEEFERNLNIIADKVQSKGCLLIIHGIPYCNELRINTENPYKSASLKNNRLFNDACKRVAQQKNAVFHDLSEVFLHNDEALLYEPDGVHLTPYCHKLLAKNYIKTLLKAFK